MTEKDYEKFAYMLRTAAPVPNVLVPIDTIAFKVNMQYHADMVVSIANIFAQDNPNFNRQRFIDAITRR